MMVPKDSPEIPHLQTRFSGDKKKKKKSKFTLSAKEEARLIRLDLPRTG
jgi:hypothetical protein